MEEFWKRPQDSPSCYTTVRLPQNSSQFIPEGRLLTPPASCPHTGVQVPVSKANMLLFSKKEEYSGLETKGRASVFGSAGVHFACVGLGS